MDWTDYFDKWMTVRRAPGPTEHETLEAARKRVQANTKEDWHWLSDALADPQQKLFVPLVFKRQPVPKRLLKAFLHAGVMERNPSINRFFIEPCSRSWGGREVSQRLLNYLQTGSNVEKSGAASAFYWVKGNPRNEDLSAVHHMIRTQLLQEFVNNEDVTVRQRIVPLLRLDELAYPPEERALVSIAIAIARSHPDEYVRHRIEVQLGAGGPFKAIPVSQRDEAQHPTINADRLCPSQLIR